MCDSAPLAKTSPSPSSPASAIIFFLRPATTTGGLSPVRGAARYFSMKSRMSESGLPPDTPMRASDGVWLTPMPKRKRPPEISWMKAVVLAKSVGWRK